MLTMPSLSGVGWTVLCLLLWKRTAALGEEVQCSVAPVGPLHPGRETQHPVLGTQHPVFGTQHPVFGTQHPVFGTQHPVRGQQHPVRGPLERFKDTHGPGHESSNSVAPPYPPEPDLTLSSMLNSDPSTMPDLLARARRSGYSEPTSSTEAELANGVVVQLAGAGADAAVTPRAAEERRPRRWPNAGDGARGGGRESFTVQCEDGRLSVSADRRVLQSSSVPVTAVTLRDSACQAQADGSHFLLVFPVVSCGTEGLLLGPPRALQDKNTFSGSAAAPTTADVGVDAPPAGPVSRAPEGPGPDPGPRRFPTPGRTSAAVLLLLKLFAAESYEQRRIGPCVVTADHRVYAEISAKGPFIDVVEVKSCVVSPLSDPKQSHFWTVVSEGCSSDPSLALRAKTKEEEEEGARGDDKVEEETGKKEEIDGLDRRGREAPERPENRSANMGAEEGIRPLRFSFILRPVYNNSIQFLHCSLRVCVSDPKKREEPTEEVKTDCQDRLRIPPLVSRSSRHQCEVRNIYRPMVVTHPIRSLAPTTDQRTKRRSLPPLAGPDPEHSGARPASLGENHVPDRSRKGPNIWTPPSDQSSSSV
ncbi:transforming growth factor beta receptor type 3 isoform X4 [Pseudoliparis swirei]|uniref:transforming growth factor beta receptor type 3 isoform X4 n=1 Tax=Pseudoliparis swirei TaxID=2059687 RepID=UPI0024BDBF39|nr:transforming growth factor beta receptor type 3 isoform X4 [Pseudoliparis swirei]